MCSAGILLSRAFWTAIRRRTLASGLPPPALAATMISRASLVNALPRSASIFPFFKRMLCHFECPDIHSPLRLCQGNEKKLYHLGRFRSKPRHGVGGRGLFGESSQPLAHEDV